MEKQNSKESAVMAGLSDRGGDVPEKRHLTYRPGQMIIKEGDFGIALYRIITGTVRVLKETDGGSLLLFELGPGDIFGEMVFIDGGRSPRTATVEAKDAVELEAWHHLSVWQEYKAANPIIRLMAADMVRKLTRINAIHDRLRIEKAPPVPATPLDMPEENVIQQIAVKHPSPSLRLADEWSEGKEWEGLIEYRLPNSPAGRMLRGAGVDIDRDGLRIDVPYINTNQGGHEPGGRLELFLHLFADEPPVKVYGEITSVSRGTVPGHTAFRIKYLDLDDMEKAKISSFLKA